MTSVECCCWHLCFCGYFTKYAQIFRCSAHCFRNYPPILKQYTVPQWRIFLNVEYESISESMPLMKMKRKKSCRRKNCIIKDCLKMKQIIEESWMAGLSSIPLLFSFYYWVTWMVVRGVEITTVCIQGMLKYTR